MKTMDEKWSSIRTAEQLINDGCMPKLYNNSLAPKNDKKEIEWFEADGCLGGQRGLVFNLETNIITKWNGSQEILSKSNADDVKWCIDNNIKNLTEQISNIQLRLNQKETKHIKIDGGYKIIEPLTETQTINQKAKLDRLLVELAWFNSINIELV
jgi:hypothetical protein